MDKVRKRLLQSYIVSFANRLVPKKRRKITFLSHIPFSDNPRVVFEEIYKRQEYEISFLYYGSASKDEVEYFRKKYPDVKVYSLFSKKGILEVLSSRVVVHNDILPVKPAYSQSIVNVWHGHPGKRTGYVHPFGTRDLYLYMDKWITHFIVSSWADAGGYSLQFHIDPRKYRVLGQPRLSRMLMNASRSKEILAEVLGDDIYNYDKIILYAPTYRYTSYHRMPEELERIINNLINSSKVLEFLKENNILLVVQPHPSITVNISSKDDNVRTISHSMFTVRDYIMYDALAAFDILVTDYSSIFEDFLLLDRPIVFYLPDWENLRKYTGFILNYDALSVGDIAENVGDLLDALKLNLEEPDRFACEREVLRRLLYEVDERFSAKRVADLVLELAE